MHRLSALLQLHLHSRFNTWLQSIGQRQLQHETRNIKVLVFGASYVRDFTIYIYNTIHIYQCFVYLGLRLLSWSASGTIRQFGGFLMQSNASIREQVQFITCSIKFQGFTIFCKERHSFMCGFICLQYIYIYVYSVKHQGGIIIKLNP